MFPASVKKGGGATCIAFPDVCKTPAPPAPFVPIPYPNSALEENLKKANETDAKAKTGNKAAKSDQAKAIENLKTSTGVVVATATQAVLIGKTLHGKYSVQTRKVPYPVRRR